MRFEIIGDDSAFNKGVAKNFLVNINGKTHTIPVKTKLVDIAKMIDPNASVASNSPTLRTNVGIVEHEQGEDKVRPVIEDTSTEIAREDLIKVVNLQKRFTDQSGNEMMDSGLVQGGIYRVFKVHQSGVTLPDKPDEITKIVHYYEVIDDKAAQPRLLTCFPTEVELYKKFSKKKLDKTSVVSELLKCEYCGEEGAFLLQDNSFVGLCGHCGKENKIERMIVLCPNEKCFTNHDRSKVSLFRHGDIFGGVCGQCHNVVEQAVKK